MPIVPAFDVWIRGSPFATAAAHDGNAGILAYPGSTGITRHMRGCMARISTAAHTATCPHAMPGQRADRRRERFGGDSRPWSGKGYDARRAKALAATGPYRDRSRSTKPDDWVGTPAPANHDPAGRCSFATHREADWDTIAQSRNFQYDDDVRSGDLTGSPQAAGHGVTGAPRRGPAAAHRRRICRPIRNARLGAVISAGPTK